MNKITFGVLSRLVLLTTLFFTGFNAYADEDLGAMTVNTVYDCPSYKYVRGSFTPETDGVYRINYSSSDRFAIYTDAELTVPYENGGDWVYISEDIFTMRTMGYETWNFVGGTTYYLGGMAGSGLFIMNSGAKICITESTSELHFTEVYPAENSTISTGGTAQVDVTFDSSVNLESATVAVAGASETLMHTGSSESAVVAYGNIVSVLLKETLTKWYNEGIIAGGEALTLTLNGVCSANDSSNIYGEDGKLVLSYVVGEQPATLVSSVNTPDQMSSIKSFYFDDDASGTIALTFDRRLLNNENDKPFAVLGIGNLESENGDYYEERLPVTVDGNSVIVNLQGKLRDVASMGLSTAYSDVQIDIKNIKTADGSYVYTEGSGSLGSFTYMYTMDYIVCDIVAEFTPAKGSLSCGDNIEIWIMGEQDLRYEGVALYYGEYAVVVTDFEKYQDPDDAKATILNVKMPKLVDASGVEIADGTSVDVMLASVKAADGYDHSKDVKATYTYKVKESGEVLEGLPISISPASGSTVKELQVITFEFSTADYPNTMSYDGDKKPVLYNEAGEEVAVGNYGYADAATYMSLYVSFEEAITAEGTYKLVIPEGGMCEYAWGIENPRICPAMELTYTVGNAELQYTVTASPAPGSEIAVEDLNQFTVTFGDVQKIDFSTEAWHGYVLRVDEKGNTLEEFPATCDMISDVAYTVTMDRAATEAGIYRLVIPEAAVIVLDNAGVSGPNKEETFDYNVITVGIEDILNDATSFEVYTINGVRVLRNASAEDVKLLDKGIYIINGRKVIIR